MRPVDQTSEIWNSATRLFVPGWWVRAWEAASTFVDPKSMSPAPILLPMLETEQLEHLALLLAGLQQQLFTKQPHTSGPLILQLQECRKFLRASDPASIQRLSRSIELLGALRFISDGRQVKTVQALFESERWVLNDTAKGYTLEFTPGPYTCELLAGRSDAYADLVRFASGKMPATTFIGSDDGLVLWTPIWLELTPSEQTIYLQMERVMQNDFKLLHLEGVYGSPVEQLFSRVRVSKKASAGVATLTERLKIITRLGRKLVSQGLITKDLASDYFTTDLGDGHEESPLLIWQASADRMQADDHRFLLTGAERAVFDQAFCPSMFDFLKILSQGTTFEQNKTHLYQAWEKIRHLEAPPVTVHKTILVQLHGLFFEWALRRLHKGKLSLPPKWLTDELVGLCMLDDQIEKSFRHFVDQVQATQTLASILENERSLSIAASIRELTPPVIAKLRAAAGVGQTYPKADHGTKPIKIVPSIVKVDVEPHKDLVVAPTSKRLDGEDLNQSSSQVRLQRLAHEELEAMMKADAKAYAALKASYMQSLDEKQRQLMMDVERRMKPFQFDQQLKQRLVRYMVEHPATWKSYGHMVQ